MNALMEQAIQHVKDAGELVRNKYKELQVEEKGFANYVTNIDMAVQQQLHEVLSALSPNSVFISEENETNDYATKKSRWIVDPIDGTTNLIHGYPHVAISVAYYDEHQRFGIIYNPFNDELFTALSGQGAFVNGERIHVSTNQKLSGSIIGFGLPYDRTKSGATFRMVEKVYETCQDMKRKGPASLDLAYVAAGRIDGYVEKDLKIWDIAAGIVVLEEAGGRVSDWMGRALEEGLYITDIVSTNSHIHDELLAIIRTSENE